MLLWFMCRSRCGPSCFAGQGENIFAAPLSKATEPNKNWKKTNNTVTWLANQSGAKKKKLNSTAPPERRRPEEVRCLPTPRTCPEDLVSVPDATILLWTVTDFYTTKHVLKTKIYLSFPELEIIIPIVLHQVVKWPACIFFSKGARETNLQGQRAILITQSLHITGAVIMGAFYKFNCLEICLISAPSCFGKN